MEIVMAIAIGVLRAIHEKGLTTNSVSFTFVKSRRSAWAIALHTASKRRQDTAVLTTIFETTGHIQASAEPP